jgi:pyruvate formate lyase activating enzyme
MIFDIQEFSVHDGPGIRTTVFLKGCPLRCSWCHNPEGQKAEPQKITQGQETRIAGRSYTSGELAQIINRQAEILHFNGGGVTFSGGEVLMQTDFVLETIAAIPGVHVVADTSGFGRLENFKKLAIAVDLIFFDLKIADAELHRRFTGEDNRSILINLALLKTLKTPFVARIPLIPGVTDTDANLDALAGLLRDAPNLQKVDLLPYNPMAGSKYRACGMTFCPGFDENQPVNFNKKHSNKPA